MQIKNAKFAMFLNNLDYGGAQKIQTFLANESVNEFKEVYIIVERTTPIRFEIDERIKVIFLPEINFKKNNLFNKLVKKINSIVQLRKVYKHLKLDLVCVFNFDAAYISVLSKIGLKLKMIGSERRAPMLLSLHKKILSKIFFGKCDYMVFQLKEAQQFYGKEIIRKSEVIPNPNLNKSSILNYNVNECSNLVTVAAARFEHEKGIDLAIKSMVKVVEKYKDIKMDIYGKGHLLDHYNELIDSLNLKENIEFKGTTDNVSKVAAKGFVFLLPSRSEGIPNTLLEVMSNGIPSISCDCPPGGPRYLTKNGERAVLVGTEDYNAIARNIILLFENKELRKKISDKSKEVIIDLDKNIIFSKWKIAFEKALE
ncbi:hypothetical protein AYO36_00870 [Exiguobacterium sp. KKBO11]|uniref:glycosyltransferase n=1 Tax=Exiguobacterium sp. KKBO11 TaxID=1805000 RepID=UPI0007D7E656|nr:glycosyltransferase [Exiguobacterium sp. KKBO11]OAI88722.1 hypothetical protein AYO36_00870 [Exiguobacterium sp. KKBO11]